MIEFVDELEPETIAGRLRALGEECDAVAVIAADHPLIGQTIHALKAAGKPVVTYITGQSASERAGYVGTDNRKLDRAAAWLIAQTAHGPGRIVILIGNHRCQCQDIADASFRLYIRENADHLTVEDSRPTHKEPREAYRIASGLLADLDDLVGLFTSGAASRARSRPGGKRRPVRLVCRNIGL